MPVSMEKQLERRQQILASTREMISEVGPKEINIRKLAERCGVSVPTLYNQFNSKDELIYTAASEIYRLHLEKADSTCKSTGLGRFLHILDSMDEMLKSDPRISRELVKVTPHRSESYRIGQRMHTQAVTEMKEQGDLVDWIDADYLGKRIYQTLRNVLIEWSQGRMDDKEVIVTRRTESMLMLLGVSTGKTHDKVETLLRRELKKRQ